MSPTVSQSNHSLCSQDPPPPVLKMLLYSKDPHEGTEPGLGAMSLSAHDSPATHQAETLRKPSKGGLGDFQVGGIYKDQERIVTPKKRQGLELAGGRDRLLMYSHQKISNLWMQRTLAEKQEP